MANYNTVVTPEDGLPCSQVEAKEINDLLREAVDDDIDHGFEFVYEAGEGFLEAQENGNWDELPEAVLAKVAALIVRAGRPYLEFGAAFTASRMIPGSHGGTAFRIMADGSIVHRQESWPE